MPGTPLLQGLCIYGVFLSQVDELSRGSHGVHSHPLVGVSLCSHILRQGCSASPSILYETFTMLPHPPLYPPSSTFLHSPLYGSKSFPSLFKCSDYNGSHQSESETRSSLSQHLGISEDRGSAASRICRGVREA